MNIDAQAAAMQPNPLCILAGRLVSLADDTDRAGLRQHAAMLLAMAYSLYDGEDDLGSGSR